MKSRSLGFVLPMVLIVIALLSALSLGLSQMARSEMENLQLRKSLWEDEKLARIIMERSIYGLLVGSYDEQDVSLDNSRIPLNGKPFKMGDGVVRVQDGAGLVGFAVFNREKFQHLMEQLTDKTTALKISMELADWVDIDDRRRFRGKEKANYISEGLLQSPRNAPIRTVDELLELPSMTPEIMNGTQDRPGLRDLVLAGGVANFNVATAPAVLIRPVLGISRDRSQRIIAARDKGEWSRVLSLIDRDEWIFNDLPPFFKARKYGLLVEGKNGHRIRGQVELTPYRNEGLYSVIEWHAPEYPYD